MIETPGKNLFMMCDHLNRHACTQLPDGYHTRLCRRDELDLWMAMPFDNNEEAQRNRKDMEVFFNAAYALEVDVFFETCLFVCDKNDTPVATAFIWHGHDSITTLHWLKVIKGHEGKGIGRALLSHILSELNKSDFPVYLHTQPSSYRAIKLYSDFGFALLTDPKIGTRKNDFEECLSMLERCMTEGTYRRLKTTRAPVSFLKRLANETSVQF